MNPPAAEMPSIWDMFQTVTFGNVWYWIITIIAWSVVCHWTLGVPYDALVRADHKGGEAAAQVEAMGRASIARLTGLLRSGGVWIVALGAFFAAVIATLGFWSGIEIAQGAALLIVPMLGVAAANARLAFRLEAEAAEGATLRRALLRRRFWNQAIGLGAITVAAGFGAWHVVSAELAAAR
jgi:hypothetical protein